MGVLVLTPSARQLRGRSADMLEDMRMARRVAKAKAQAKKAGRKDLVKEVSRLYNTYSWAGTRKGFAESGAKSRRAQAAQSPEYFTETHGAVGGALVGGALFGPAGAVVGAMTTARTEVKANPYHQYLEDRAAALEDKAAQHESDEAAAKADLLALVEFIETNL